MGETGKPDVDDISLDDARAPKRKGGTSLVLGLVLLIIIAGVVLWMAKESRDRAEAKKRVEDARIARDASLAIVNDQVKQAMTDAQSGKLDDAIGTLTAVENKLSLLTSDANTAGDQDAANQTLLKGQAVTDARKGLEEIRASIAEKLTPLATAFGIAPPAPAAGAAAATGTETVPPATGTETPPPPPAAEGAPVAPEATPAAPVAPPAPAAVAPAAPGAATPVAPPPVAN